jgi:apolipoprotein N-acyltransferase
LGTIITSKSHARVYLGNRDDSNKENFRIGRLHFHINWSYVGFASWEGEKLSKRQQIASFAGGPIMSFILVLLFVLIAILVPQKDLHSLFWGAAFFNFVQFMVTIIPMNYPRWWGAYDGHPSDGLQLLRLLKG